MKHYGYSTPRAVAVQGLRFVEAVEQLIEAGKSTSAEFPDRDVRLVVMLGFLAGGSEPAFGQLRGVLRMSGVAEGAVREAEGIVERDAAVFAAVLRGAAEHNDADCPAFSDLRDDVAF